MSGIKNNVNITDGIRLRSLDVHIASFFDSLEKVFLEAVAGVDRMREDQRREIASDKKFYEAQGLSNVVKYDVQMDPVYTKVCLLILCSLNKTFAGRIFQYTIRLQCPSLLLEQRTS